MVKVVRDYSTKSTWAWMESRILDWTAHDMVQGVAVALTRSSGIGKGATFNHRFMLHNIKVKRKIRKDMKLSLQAMAIATTTVTVCNHFYSLWKASHLLV